jgi:serine/threonine protein kinase
MDCTVCHTPIPDGRRFCLSCGADASDPGVSTRQRAAIRELHETLKSAVEGHYRIVDMLGRGGMGAVFLAEDLRLGRMVAIKVLRAELADEASVVGRFTREARIAAGLDHPNIIPIYAVEQAGDFHYFVMKHVSGRTLDELLQGTPLPVEQTREILCQAADALAHAHERGIVHRDVKPSNIMLDDQGRVLLMDFGISKALESGTQYTSTGQMIGTPRYVSPEQALGGALDGRSDQYSLAIVGYEMLTGSLPLTGDSVHVLMYKHVHEMPAPVRSVRAEVPPAVSNALQRALAKKPEQRFPTMQEFAAAIAPEGRLRSGELRSLVDSGDRTVRSAQLPVSPARTGGRSRWRGPAAAAVSLLVLGGLGLAVMRAREGGSQEPSPAASAPRTLPVPPTTGLPKAESTAMTVPALDTTPAGPVPESRRQPPRAPATPAQRPAAERQTAPSSRASATPTPSTTAAKVGYLTINAVPYGTVSVDGVEVGDTPIVRHELPPGPHKVEVARDGFRTERLDVTITASNEVRLSRSLVKAGQ